MNTNNHLRFIRKPALIDRFKLSKTTLQERINAGLIPPPIPLGARSVGFLEHEIEAVLAAMAAGKSADEIKTLVTSLVEKRSEYLATMLNREVI